MELAIKDEITLLAACDVLHDAEFDLDSAVFDAGTGHWSIALWREVAERKSVAKRGLVFDRLETPVVQAVLTLDGVSGFAVDDRSRIGTHSFNQCRRDGDGYRFEFHTEMDFVITFRDAPTGLLKDTGATGQDRRSLRLRQGS